MIMNQHYVSVGETPARTNKPVGRTKEPTIPETPEPSEQMPPDPLETSNKENESFNQTKNTKETRIDKYQDDKLIQELVKDNKTKKINHHNE